MNLVALYSIDVHVGQYYINKSQAHIVFITWDTLKRLRLLTGGQKVYCLAK